MAQRETTSPGPMDVETAARFWSKVRTTDDLFSCWEWQGATTVFGHGRFKVQGRQYSAHRVAFELSSRTLAPGEFVCHHCDNPRCVRPNHLFAGDNAENMRDCARKGRLTAPSLAGLARGRAMNRKLTLQQAREIHARYAAGKGGVTQVQLAAEYGVARQTITEILSGRRWGEARAPVSGPVE